MKAVQLNKDKREAVLIVGTTDDYIEQIRQLTAGGAFFLTDISVFRNRGSSVSEKDELVLNLSDCSEVTAALESKRTEDSLFIKGIACFDCEWLWLASNIANRLSLPFVSEASVLLCRDKHRSMTLLKDSGISCPKVALLDVEDEISIPVLNRPCDQLVLKPLTGSGSELTFLCRTQEEFQINFKTIKSKLSAKKQDPINVINKTSYSNKILAEEFVDGQEFSVDACAISGEVHILRITTKYRYEKGPFGTIEAYEMPAPFSQADINGHITPLLTKAARALGIRDSIFMTDIIWSEKGPFLLEITPRPGGDLLPDLIKESCGLDMINFAIESALDDNLSLPSSLEFKRLIGIKFFAEQAGTVNRLELKEGVRIKIIKYKWLQKEGSEIALPPEDYTSWILGYAIVVPPINMDSRDVISMVKGSLIAEIVNG